MQSVSTDSSGLESSLWRLNSFFSSLSTPFLSGDSLSHLDCEVHRFPESVVRMIES